MGYGVRIIWLPVLITCSVGCAALANLDTARSMTVVEEASRHRMTDVSGVLATKPKTQNQVKLPVVRSKASDGPRLHVAPAVLAKRQAAADAVMGRVAAAAKLKLGAKVKANQQRTKQRSAGAIKKNRASVSPKPAIARSKKHIVTSKGAPKKTKPSSATTPAAHSKVEADMVHARDATIAGQKRRIEELERKLAEAAKSSKPAGQPLPPSHVSPPEPIPPATPVKVAPEMHKVFLHSGQGSAAAAASSAAAAAAAHVNNAPAAALEEHWADLPQPPAVVAASPPPLSAASAPAAVTEAAADAAQELGSGVAVAHRAEEKADELEAIVAGDTHAPIELGKHFQNEMHNFVDRTRGMLNNLVVDVKAAVEEG